MKSTTEWKNNSNGNNISSFSALPSGIRGDYNATFYEIGTACNSWASIIAMSIKKEANVLRLKSVAN